MHYVDETKVHCKKLLSAYCSTCGGTQVLIMHLTMTGLMYAVS